MVVNCEIWTKGDLNMEEIVDLIMAIIPAIVMISVVGMLMKSIGKIGGY